MKAFSFLNIFKRILALFLVVYFSILSPVVALAQVSQPVSAPISIPVPLPTPTPTPSPTPSPSPSPTPSPSPIPKPTIFVNNYSVKSGENLNVSWNIPNASNTDYIRVLTTDGTNRSVGPNGISPSNNCNLNNVSGPNAVKVGSCTFTSAVIADLGTFKLGYYNSSGTLLASSNPFHVQAASNGTFTASPNNIGIGSSVNLNWANITNAHPKDYINYLNSDNYTGTATGHTYWPSNNCKWFTDSTLPRPSGSCSIESPLIPGNFKLVYRSGNVPVGQPAPILAVTNVVAVGQLAPITISTDSVVVSLDRANAQYGLVYGPGFTIKSNSATGWQIKYSQPTQGQGFYESSGGINPGSSTNIRTYINTNKPNGTYVGLATVQYYKGGIWQDGPSVKYTITLTETTPKADLTVLSASPAGQLKVGSPATITVTVKNIGDADADIKNDVFYIYYLLKRNSDNKIIPTNPYFTQAIQNLKAGEIKTFTVSSIDNLTTAGRYTISVEIDALKQIAESNENNNKYSLTFNVAEAANINSITPNSGVVSSIAAVYGSGFGNKIGTVVFYNQYGQAAAGAPVLGWYNSGVKFRVPSLAKGAYFVEIHTADGVKSNRVNFTVTAPQPVVSTIWPAKLRVGNYMVIWGSNFGSSGKINFYKPGSTAASASAINYYWSNSLIIAKIPGYLIGNQEYGIQVRILNGTDLLDSSLIYRYISK